MTLEDKVKICTIVKNAVDKIANSYSFGIKDLTVNQEDFYDDKYGTFCAVIRGGRNGSLVEHSQYYFNQISFLFDILKTEGVKAWPVNLDFDVPDDTFKFRLGLEWI